MLCKGRTAARLQPSARRQATVARGLLGFGGSNQSSSTKSLDPWGAQPFPHTAGKLLSVHSPDEVQQLLEANKDKLVVLQCKASHCKPCKAFAKTYIHLAEVFRDSVLAEITGDETPDTRKLMMEWKIKSTPTFRLYRNGELLTTFSGAKDKVLVQAITQNLTEKESGFGYKLVEAINSDED